jgi:hypothetical protein
MSTKKYITQPYNIDGFGAQYQSIIYTILYAEKNDVEYVYSKPNYVIIYGEEQQEYLENIINLSKKYKTVEEVGKENVMNIEAKIIMDAVDQNIDYYFTNSTELKKIIDSFKENKDLNVFSNMNEVINVVIHIRRPNNLTQYLGGSILHVDFNDLPSISERFTHDDYFLFIIDNIRKSNKNHKTKFHIISEGEIEKFAKYDQEDIEIHLNEPIEKTFIRMVMANCLITSASSFSYTAALLNESNHIIYKSFWHPKLKIWQSIES